MLMRSIGVLLSLLSAACSVAAERPPLAQAGIEPVTQPDTPAAPPRGLPVTSAPADAAAAPGAVIVDPGVPLPVIRKQENGAFLVHSVCGRKWIAPRATPVPYVDVVIDPGHGGDHPGAVGPGGLAEKIPNLQVSRRLANILERRGYTTLLTRTGNYRVALATRAAFATALRPQVFISVHFNAEPDEPRSTPGAEMYYQHRSPSSKRLAGLVYEEIFATLARHRISWVGDRDAGVKPRINEVGDDYYAVVRMTQGTPAVLTESAFISNPGEEALIGDTGVQRRLAKAMARGIERFLTTDAPGSGYVKPYHRDSASSNTSDADCVDPDLGLREVS